MGCLLTKRYSSFTATSLKVTAEAAYEPELRLLRAACSVSAATRRVTGTPPLLVTRVTCPSWLRRGVQVSVLIIGFLKNSRQVLGGQLIQTQKRNLTHDELDGAQKTGSVWRPIGGSLPHTQSRVDSAAINECGCALEGR